MMLEAKKRLVIMGMSGSHDYLKDDTGARRYWPVRDPLPPPDAPLLPADRACIDALIVISVAPLLPVDRACIDLLNVISAGKWLDEEGALKGMDEGAPCDGLHDEGAPSQYLCTRCFPYGRDSRGNLEEEEDDDDDDDDDVPEDDGVPEDAAVLQDEDQELA